MESLPNPEGLLSFIDNNSLMRDKSYLILDSIMLHEGARNHPN